MKISKSKQELARIISENGGWRGGNNWAWYGNATGSGYFANLKPKHNKANGSMDVLGVIGSNIHAFRCAKIPNWHQTILSRAEYFHLYPAPDADGWIEWNGGERPVGKGDRIDAKFSDGDTLFNIDSHWDWTKDADKYRIIAYRLHKPEQAKPEYCESVMRSIPEPDEHAWTNPPTIEQLATDYRNAKEYAERKQQEADDAKADADARLKALELAGEALGLIVSPITAKQDPELLITDWREWRVDDEVECVDTPGGAECMRGDMGIITRVGSDGVWARFEGAYRDGRCEWFSMGGKGYRFIRRP